jgi:hypothetical protein
MGHYDEQRDYDDYERNLASDRYLIREIRKNQYNVLVDAAHMANSPTVQVSVETFHRMLAIIRRLDADNYTYQWER